MTNYTVEQWATHLATTLNLDDSAATTPPLTELLDLTREVAHNVARPAGPITTYYIGLAVARAGGDVDEARRLIAEISNTVPHTDHVTES